MSIPGSLIVIEYDGSDISDHVLYSDAMFESQLNAQPGQFQFTVRDVDRDVSFVTGKSVTLTVDGIRMFGGYVTQVTRKFAFPVDDTSDPVRSRQWVLRGVDYNILFDKRVLRNTANYIEQIPNLTVDTYDGDAIKMLASTYLDVPTEIDTETFVENITVLPAPWAWMTPGSTWRQQMDSLVLLSGAVYYIDPNGNLIWRGLEDSEAKWGFSDVPNHRSVTASPSSFQGATIGFRDMDAVEDGSFIVNDAFVWGGNAFSGDAGSPVFAREQNATSISEHGRWQYPEQHFGDSNYASQRLVDDRADIIVNGLPGSTADEANRGLRFSQWQIKLSWFSHDVPRVSGAADHLRPGDLTTHIFYVLGTDNAHPLIQQLPLRQMRITFPTLKEDGTAYLRFDGFWSLQLDDPYTLWAYLLSAKTRVTNTILATANGDTTTATYGAFGQFAPLPDPPDGTTRLFNLPNNLGYLAGTTQVYINGILAPLGTSYTESNPDGGEITFYSAPSDLDVLWVICRTTGTV